MLNLIFSLVAITIFVVYNIVALCVLGMPRSLSETFYLYNAKKPKLGYIFTAMMFVVGLLLMPAWLNITEVVSEWSHHLTVLPFLAAGSILFVGAAPAYRDCKLENKVHMVSAALAAVFSLLWCAVVCYKIAWIIPISLVLCWGIAFATKTNKTGRDWWWEMVAFLATFATIVTECVMLL